MSEPGALAYEMAATAHASVHDCQWHGVDTLQATEPRCPDAAGCHEHAGKTRGREALGHNGEHAWGGLKALIAR